MKRRSGQTAVMMALSLTLIFGLFGFTVDLGSSYYQKQKAQGAAESAALAAASYAKTNGVTCGTNGITCNSTLTSCSSITSTSSPILYVGCQYAKQNGFPMSSISMAANLTSTTAPPCSNCGSPTYWIQSQVSTTNNNLFLGIANIANPNINAAAVAGVTSQTSQSGAGVPAVCLWVLDPTDKQTLLISSGSLTLTSCKAQVNSSATDPVNKQPSNVAANTNGSGTITPATGGPVQVVGAGDYNQNYCPSNGPYTCGAASVADPLASLPDLNETSVFGSTNCTKASQYSPTGNITIPSGIYCGGINISSGNITFATGGTFEIRDGGLSISNGTTTGSNVMFYFSTANPTTTADPVVNINTSNVTLSAPSSGTYQGILFYGNRHAKIAASGTNNVIQAGSKPNITGTFYFPTGNFLLSGQAGFAGTNYIVIDAYTVQINGQSTLKWDSTGTYTGLATYGSSTTTTYTPALIQ